MANLYQMMIKVITIKSDTDDNPKVNSFGPDPELNAFKLLPVGSVPDMTLLHYDDMHFNLIIDGDGDLAKLGILSDYVENIEKEEMVIDESPSERETSLKKKLEDLSVEYNKSQNIIKMLKNKIKILESKDCIIESNDDEVNDEHLDEGMILKNKNFGFQRESPQFEPSLKNLKHHFKSDKCENKEESKENSEVHMQIHREQSNFRCDHCDFSFKNESQLNEHMETDHEEETYLEFNCMDCPYQGHTEGDLTKHIVAAHEPQPKNTQKRESLPCHSCGEPFETKHELRVHRKKEHPDIIKKCRYFIEGRCDYDNDMCHFSHELEETPKNTAQNFTNLNCKYCGKPFETKSELMFHRKAEHPQVVKQCRDFRQGLCDRGENGCWYNHSDSLPSEQSSFFQKVPRNPPPDILMNKVVGMMEKMMLEIAVLKKQSMEQQLNAKNVKSCTSE